MKKLIQEYKIALAFIGKVSDKNTKEQNKQIQKNINSVNKQFVDRAISINNENNTVEVKDNRKYFLNFSNGVKQEIEKQKEFENINELFVLTIKTKKKEEKLIGIFNTEISALLKAVPFVLNGCSYSIKTYKL